MKTILIMALCVAATVSCVKKNAANSAPAVEASAEKTYTLTYAHPFPPGDSPHHKAGVFLKDYMDTMSNGKISVELYPSGQLGNDASTFPQLEAGTLAVTQVATRNFAGFFPEMQVLEIPYLFTGVDAQSFMESPFVDYLDALVKTRLPNVLVTGLSFNGYRQWMMSSPVSSYADLAGYKFRSIPSPLHDKFYQDMGLNPVSVPWGDVYTALSTGVISGMDQPFTDVLANNFSDFIKYAYIDDNIFHSVTWLVSETWLAQLPGDLQELVLDGMDRIEAIFTLEYFINESVYEQKFMEMGGSVTRIIDSDIPRRDQQAKVMYDWFFSEYGEKAEAIWEVVTKNIEWSESNQSTRDYEWVNNY